MCYLPPNVLCFIPEPRFCLSAINFVRRKGIEEERDRGRKRYRETVVMRLRTAKLRKFNCSLIKFFANCTRSSRPEKKNAANKNCNTTDANDFNENAEIGIDKMMVKREDGNRGKMVNFSWVLLEGRKLIDDDDFLAVVCSYAVFPCFHRTILFLHFILVASCCFRSKFAARILKRLFINTARTKRRQRKKRESITMHSERIR